MNNSKPGRPVGKQANDIDLNPVAASITDGFFTLDDRWNVTYWNQEIENISGIEVKNAIGKGMWNIFSNQGNLKLYSECRRAKQENISIRFEEFYPTLNKWIEVYAYPTDAGVAVFVKNITELKDSQAALMLTNERYDLVVKATNDLVWDWNIITGEIYRNSAGVQRVYGHSNNESIQTNQLWSERIHPEDKKHIDQLIAYYISSEDETFFSFEYRFRREDGFYNYINDKGYIIRNDLGIVVRMIGSARNISVDKQLALEIRESEQRYKSFVQQSTEGIWRVELDKPIAITSSVQELIDYCMTSASIAECNDAFAKMYGFETADHIIGTPLSKLLPATDPVNRTYLEKFFSNGFKVEGEISYEIDKGGNQLIFINNMHGIVENGYLQCAWGTQRDITQQQKIEWGLVASEKQYKDLFNNNPCCIFIWNLDNLMILEANQSAVDLYGYSLQEFKKLTAQDIRSYEDHAEFLEMAEIARHNEQYKKTKTGRHITKSGNIIYIEITTQYILYNGDRCLLAIGNNVTDKVQLEMSVNRERQIMQKQITDAVLMAQEKERAQLGEELHDNINQILASSRLYVECAIADDNLRKDLLRKTKCQLDTAMTEIRKLSKNLVAPTLGNVGLVDSLEELIDDMTSVNHLNILKDWKGFNEKKINEKLKLTIFRIVQEQLNNIHRHSQAKNAWISLTQNGDKQLLTIKDDGIGFDPESKRTGVGLRNINSRAEVNNGTLHIRTAPGQGCTITIEFSL
ncbi:MAG: PAS domain S-box protein [Ferruginibacter sp.]